jgi:hypothetical protein
MRSQQLSNFSFLVHKLHQNFVDNFCGFLIAEFPRIEDKMVVMRIGDVHAEIAADILLTGAIGFSDVWAASFLLSLR